jgi:hypothetical protein
LAGALGQAGAMETDGNEARDEETVDVETGDEKTEGADTGSPIQQTDGSEYRGARILRRQTDDEQM